MKEYKQHIQSAAIQRLTDRITAEGNARTRCIRFYCTRPGHEWNLQLFAPQGIGPTGSIDGKHDMLANAYLDRNSLMTLRDAIDETLSEE